MSIEENDSLRQLLDTNADGITILEKTSRCHVHQVLRCSPEENLRIIREIYCLSKTEKNTCLV